MKSRKFAISTASKPFNLQVSAERTEAEQSHALYSKDLVQQLSESHEALMRLPEEYEAIKAELRSRDQAIAALREQLSGLETLVVQVEFLQKALRAKENAAKALEEQLLVDQAMLSKRMEENVALRSRLANNEEALAALKGELVDSASRAHLLQAELCPCLVPHLLHVYLALSFDDSAG